MEWTCQSRQGVDGLVEVPFTRWELEEVWDPNPDAQGKMLLGQTRSSVFNSSHCSSHAKRWVLKVFDLDGLRISWIDQILYRSDLISKGLHIYGGTEELSHQEVRQLRAYQRWCVQFEG